MSVTANFPQGGGVSDTSDATVTANNVVTGKTIYGASGEKITGSFGSYVKQVTINGITYNLYK